MTDIPELQRKLVEAAAAEDQRITLINYWWETTGWVRPD